MKESIVCVGRIGTKPYRFKDTGIEISSYEELVYYIRNHLLCYLYTLPEDDLLDYISEELGLEKLSRQLMKLTDPSKDQMKYLSTLFREGHYYGEDEIRDILDEYRALKNESYSRQCKKIGDMLMQHGRAGRAILYYNEAIAKDAGEAKEAGRAYHNLGVAEAKLFRFRDARIHFLRAYQNAEEEQSLFYYFVMTAFTEGAGKALEELKAMDISELTIESFETKFGDYVDSFRYTDQANRFDRWTFLSENGRDAEAKGNYENYIHQLQVAFRRELVPGEPLSSPKVPMANEK